MKYFSKILLGASVVSAAMFASCDKKDALASYANGSAVLLTSSTTTIAATAADSNKSVVTFSWSSPKYATDTSTYKYILEMDSSGRNFAKETTWVITGARWDTLTAKQINAVLLSYGFAYNKAYNVDVRITSSYANNNEQYKSNVITLKMTPYVTPPKVAPPTTNKLFLVGNATQGGWNNPVPVPTQQFAKIDSVTYAGVFNLIGGNQYLVLPLNGDWSNKYAISDPSVPATGGAFGYNFSTNFNGPATSGWYTIVLNFQAGTFTVTPFTGVMPTNLFIVGSATPGGWNNPVPVPSQQLTQNNSAQFSINLPFIGGQQYLLLPVNGDWSNKYAVANGNVPSSGGAFGYNLSTNFNGPANSGSYTLTVDFTSGTYTLK
jgi:hypothetical protein